MIVCERRTGLLHRTKSAEIRRRFSDRAYSPRVNGARAWFGSSSTRRWQRSEQQRHLQPGRHSRAFTSADLRAPAFERDAACQAAFKSVHVLPVGHGPRQDQLVLATGEEDLGRPGAPLRSRAGHALPRRLRRRAALARLVARSSRVTRACWLPSASPVHRYARRAPALAAATAKASARGTRPAYLTTART